MRLIRKLKQGDPVTENWRTVNELVERVNWLAAVFNRVRADLAELRTRPRDADA